MRAEIMGAEMMGLLVILIIALTMVLEKNKGSKRNQLFLIIIALDAVTLFCDIEVWACIGIKQFGLLWKICNTVLFAAPFMVNSFFIMYMFVHHLEDKSLSKNAFRAGVIMSQVAAIVVLFLNAFSSAFYSVTDGVYHEGKGFTLFLIVNIIMFIYFILLMIHNVKMFGRHDSIAAISFFVIPLIGMICDFFVDNGSIAIASTPLTITIVYLMLQSNQAHALLEARNKEQLKARYDDLTGLYNRLAYTERCDGIEKNVSTGIVFCDLNGLKYTNDHYGHKAGDLLLKHFAGILIESFRKDEIYRISGDEFVVIIVGIGEEAFANRVKGLKGRIAREEKPIAAVGQVYGNSDAISKLIDFAEEKMYEDKKDFYEKYPEYVRK